MASATRPPIHEIHRRVGRNVLEFQAIEQALRFILPYIHPKASKQGLAAMRKYRRGKVRKRSLGMLVDQFNEAVSGDKDLKGLIQRELKALVKARNDLVHQFYRNHRFNLLAADGAAAAIAYLDEQHERFRESAKFFRAQTAAVLLKLMEADPKVAAGLGQYRAMLVAQQ
jgi:hypothetical protein